MATRHLSLLHSPQCEHTQANLHHELDDYYSNSFIIQTDFYSQLFLLHTCDHEFKAHDIV